MHGLFEPFVGQITEYLIWIKTHAYTYKLLLGMEVNRIAFYSYGDTIPGVAFVYNTNDFIFFCFHF